MRVLRQYYSNKPGKLKADLVKNLINVDEERRLSIVLEKPFEEESKKDGSDDAQDLETVTRKPTTEIND